MICPRKIAALALSAGLGLLLAHAGPVPRADASQAQTAPPPQQQEPIDPRAVIRSNVQLVVVPVTVKDKSGKLIGDLKQSDFRVFDEDTEQHISLFSTDAFPLSAVMLVDGDLSTRTVDEVQKNLIAVAGGFSADDEVAIAKFSAFFTPMYNFTSDNELLITELGKFDFTEALPGTASATGPAPTTIGGQPSPQSAQDAARNQNTKHINDALYSAAELLRDRDRERRKVIVLISDGVNAKDNMYSYDETLRMVLSSNIAVYAIGVDQAFYKRKLNVLSKFAHDTGGDVYYPSNGAALSKLYTQVTDQARHQYTIAYVPSRSEHVQDYHSIEVRVRRTGLNVLARDGYYLFTQP